MQLEPAERFSVVEAILRSTDEPELSIDEIWIDEAKKRLDAYRDG